jgi:alpha-glucosidase
MQWEGIAQAGFTTDNPWLPVHSDYLNRNVAEQKGEQGSLLECTRRLIELHKDLPALRNGLFMPLIYEPRSLLAYLRKNGEQTVLIVINFRRSANRLVLGGSLSGPQWRLIFSSKGRSLEMLNARTLQLAGNEALILEQR